jgi:hypothetical protein
LALAVVAGSLWVALAFSSHQSLFYNHLAWWLAGTAIGAIFLAALIAGVVSGTRGTVSGLANGLTTWGLIVIGALAAGIPGLVAFGSTRPVTVNGAQVMVTTVRPWSTFWALLIGLGAAGLGGLMGGAWPRRPEMERVVDVTDTAVAGPTTTEPVAATEADETPRTGRTVRAGRR